MRTWLDIPYVTQLGVLILQLYLTSYFYEPSISLIISSCLNVLFVGAHACATHRSTRTSTIAYGVPLLFGFPFAFSSFAFPSSFNYAWRVGSVSVTLFTQMIAHALWVRAHSTPPIVLVDAILSEPFDSCAICLEKMERGVTFACVHTFHSACILLYIEKNRPSHYQTGGYNLGVLCPLCRTPLTITN